ncbi:MAG: hypothetical protein AB1609_22200, partial [Bacillota bacterium]
MPRFILGFKTLADLLEGIIGRLTPLENEHFNPESGDSLQAVRMPDGFVGPAQGAESSQDGRQAHGVRHQAR